MDRHDFFKNVDSEPDATGTCVGGIPEKGKLPYQSPMSDGGRLPEARLRMEAHLWEPKTNAAKFEGGATRSHHAPRYELIPKAAVDRLVKRLELGAGIHGDYNWMGGGPEFVAQCKRHLMEHLLNYLGGDVSDDHLGAIICNAAFLAHFEAKASLAPVPASPSPREPA